MRQKRFSLFQLLLAAALTAAVVLAAGALAVNYLLGGAGGRSLVEAWHLINTRFVGEYDQDAVIDGALEGMVNALGDRWSYTLTADELSAQNQRRTNQYVGIGITVNYANEEGLEILEVAAGGHLQDLQALLVCVVDGDADAHILVGAPLVLGGQLVRRQGVAPPVAQGVHHALQRAVDHRVLVVLPHKPGVDQVPCLHQRAAAGAAQQVVDRQGARRQHHRGGERRGQKQLEQRESFLPHWGSFLSGYQRGAGGGQRLRPPQVFVVFRQKPRRVPPSADGGIK